MFNLQDLPSSHGTYALHLHVSGSYSITLGRLGPAIIPAGYYFYLGSARGAGGLRARVGRHLSGDGTLHWHIDYLRGIAEVQSVFYTVTDNALECPWCQALATLPEALIPIPHFGSSDCRSGCEAHLIVFPRQINVFSVRRALEQVTRTPITHLCFK